MSVTLGRVAVYGQAVRTPLGFAVDAVLARLLDGERAAMANPLFDARTYPCTLAAALPGPPKLAPRHRKFLRRMGLFAVEVAIEAMHDARQRMPALDGLPGERLGLFFGYGGLRAPWDELMPAMQAQTDELVANWDHGLRLLHPFFMLQQLSNNAHALCAEELTARGEGVTLSGANAGAQALACAQAALLSGAVDAALCVAYDSLLAPEVLIEQGLRGALTTAREPRLLRAPYTSTAAGAVPGEAAAALLLLRDEPRETPARFFVRGGDAAGGDEATTLLRAATQVLDKTIKVIDGAAQGLPRADLDERRVLASSGLLADDAVLTATLAGLGQVGAAAPLVQAVLLAAALRLGKLPPVAGLSSQTGDVVPDGPLPPLGQPMATEARAALCLSVGPPRLCGAVHVEIEGRTST